MDSAAVARILDAAERAVEADEPLGPSGFWRAVAAAKRDPALVEQHGRRISTIDRAAFRQWAWVVIPIGLGTVIMSVATMGGLGLIWWSYYLTDLAAAAAFLAGFGVILTTTHGLAHLVVGTIVGIDFTHWFIASVITPQPGVKTEYESYLRAPARSRAWMHASGALVTKVVPFALIGAALASGAPGWVAWAMLFVGVATIVTDVVWSTGSSDWKRFRREMDLAQ